MRLVLDTNILISAFLWKGTTHRFIELVEENEIQLFTTHILLNELRDTLQSKKLALAITASGFSAHDFVRRYRDMTSLITARKMTQQICRDADDDAVLACALAARAQLIVTGDKDLRILHPFQNIAILPPADALKLIDNSTIG